MRNRLQDRLVAISKAAEVDQEEKDRAIANTNRMMDRASHPDSRTKGVIEKQHAAAWALTRPAGENGRAGRVAPSPALLTCKTIAHGIDY